MPRNGSGSFSLVSNSWSPATNGTPATSADWQTLINDVAAALTQSLSKDGQTPLTGNLAAGGNKVTGLAAASANGDAVRFEQIPTLASLGAAASGANSDITSLTAVTALTRAAGVAITGTATNDNAAAGFVGEYVEAQRLFSAPLAMTTAFAASVTSIPLTAGDWDVQGQLGIVTATTTTVSSVAGYIDTAVSALNLDRVGIVRDNYAGQAINTPALGAPILTTGATRISLSAPATVHLVGHAGFGNSTLSMFGAIHARRVR